MTHKGEVARIVICFCLYLQLSVGADTSVVVRSRTDTTLNALASITSSMPKATSSIVITVSKGKTPLSTAIVTDAGSREGGSGLVLYVSIGLGSAFVALIAAAVIVTVRLIKRKKHTGKYRTDGGRNNSELKGNACCSTQHKEDATYDHGNATYTHFSIAPINGNSAKHGIHDTYDHLPPAPPAIHDYASIAIKSDDDIITTQNEAYANSIDISVSTNSAYGLSHHK